jgi:hypothetical protein
MGKSLRLPANSCDPVAPLLDGAASPKGTRFRGQHLGCMTISSAEGDYVHGGPLRPELSTRCRNVDARPVHAACVPSTEAVLVSAGCCASPLYQLICQPGEPGSGIWRIDFEKSIPSTAVKICLLRRTAYMMLPCLLQITGTAPVRM